MTEFLKVDNSHVSDFFVRGSLALEFLGKKFALTRSGKLNYKTVSHFF